MLKDAQGRTVLWKHRGVEGFYALDGIMMVPVQEAIISKGDEVFVTPEYIQSVLDKEGFGHLKFEFTRDSWSTCKILGLTSDNNWDCWNRSSYKQTFYINGKTVDESAYRKVVAIQSEINSYAGIMYNNIFLQSGLKLACHIVLEMIGEGQKVTVKSLERGCAIGEDRPRLLPGDAVVAKSRGKDVLGVIKTLNSKVVVMTKAGVKMNCAFANVSRTEEDGHSEELASQTDLTIQVNFDYVFEVGKKRLYKAKLERGPYVFPVFPDKDEYGRPEEQRSEEDVPSCACPVCGWRMGESLDPRYSYNNNRDRNEMQCNYCRIKGLVIARSETDVTLLMNRMPGKNRFALKEARCCGNCGRFEFETGREGKRSTGYCRTANQCLQAFNTCDLWFPRDLKRYESNMRQHITNLHYGVKDTRNTSRNDIRDTVYTEEDHKAEMKRAEDAKVSYANAYQRLMKRLRETAAAMPIVEGSIETTEAWKAVLDDPC